MNCADYQERILDLLDERLAAADRHQVELHVATCPSCRRFWSEQRALDARLAAVLPRPALSANFRQRVLDATATAGAHATVESRDRSRRALQTEFEAACRALGRQVLWSNVPGWLDIFAWVLAAVIGGLVLHYFVVGAGVPAPNSPEAVFENPLVLVSLLGGGLGLIWSWKVAVRSGVTLNF